MNDRITLLSALTTNTSGSAFMWPGGRGVFCAWGTFGGGTCDIEFSPDGTTWINADRSGETFVTFTANGVGEFVLPQGLIRATVAGGAAASISAIAGKAF
jgi:hypothetical protein